MTRKTDLSLIVNVADIDAEPREYRLTGQAPELLQLVDRFKIVSLENLEAHVTVKKMSEPKAIHISGTVNSRLVQQCGVTLQDVPENIDEPFELLLVSPETAAAFDEDELYADPEAPDYDAFEGDSVPLGEIVVQTVAVMMNPYPRAPGAEVKPIAGEGVTVNEDPLEKPNPFEVLSKLRDKS